MLWGQPKASSRSPGPRELLLWTSLNIFQVCVLHLNPNPLCVNFCIQCEMQVHVHCPPCTQISPHHSLKRNVSAGDRVMGAVGFSRPSPDLCVHAVHTAAPGSLEPPRVPPTVSVSSKTVVALLGPASFHACFRVNSPTPTRSLAGVSAGSLLNR